jgi:DHA2 family multidrug resistance protein
MTIDTLVSDRINPRRLIAFLAMCFGMFMAFLDIQVVSASLTEISRARRLGGRNLVGADVLPDRGGRRDPTVRLSSRALGTRWMFAGSPPASRSPA